MLQNLTSLINSLTSLVGGGLSTLLMGIAFLAFLAAVINFIIKRAKGGSGYGGDNGLQQAKSMLGWSIIGIFVMVSIWGLVNFISVNLGTTQKEIAKPQTTWNTPATTPAKTNNQ